MFWLMASHERACYALQRPDPNYADLWVPVSRSLQRAAGVAAPAQWVLADVDDNCPKFVSTWAWDMVCLEQGARQPGDPRSSTHWPLTQEAVERFNDGEEYEFTILDEEDGSSDASSLTDCYESDRRALPTGLHWRLPGWEQRALGDEPLRGEEPQNGVETADKDAVPPPSAVHNDTDVEGELEHLADPTTSQFDLYSIGSMFQPVVAPELRDRTAVDWRTEPSHNWTPGLDHHH